MLDVAKYVRPGIEGIQPYVPGLTDDELKRLYGLKRVIKLNANENALGPSPFAIQAIQDELKTLHHYPDGGSELLRQAIAKFHNVATNHVLVGNGSDDIIKLLSETFLDPGDQIIMPTPSFSQYAFGAAIMRANVVSVPLTDTFEYDVKALAGAVTPRTKIIYVCSPNNPTGTILTTDQAEWLLSHLPAHVVVVFDLAYNDFTTAPDRIRENDWLLSDERVVVLHTFSKLYGLAGLRVGYGLAHPQVWDYVNRVREPFNVNRVGQRAAAAALEDEAHRQASLQHVAQSAAFYADAVKEIGLHAVPTYANFVLVRTGNGIQTMNELMKRGIMVRAGFHRIEEYVRITFGTSEENDACVRALQEQL